jgi:hypothetical protein
MSTEMKEFQASQGEIIHGVNGQTFMPLLRKLTLHVIEIIQ